MSAHDPNESWSIRLGWKPSDFGAADFDDTLVAAVKEYQRAWPGLNVDGIAGPATWRRMQLARTAPSLVSTPPDAGDCILVDGHLKSIPWPKVITPGEQGHLGLPKICYRPCPRRRAVDLVVTHWDVAYDARGCHRTLTRAEYSTHFCIDWDGTIYQMVDVANEAWHVRTSGINARSIGVDLNNPVYLTAQERVVAAGQPARPVMNGYRINSRATAPFLGFHDVQIDAYCALLAGLAMHIPTLRLERVGTEASTGKHVCLAPDPDAVRGVCHHAEVQGNKWDCLGAPLDLVCARAIGLLGLPNQVP